MMDLRSFVALCSFALLLAACSGNTTPTPGITGDAARKVSETSVVEGEGAYSGPESDVVAPGLNTAQLQTQAWQKIGTITADGKLTLELPSQLANSQTNSAFLEEVDFGKDQLCGDIVKKGDDAEGYSISYFGIEETGQTIVQASPEPATPSGQMYNVVRIYVDKEVILSGTCSDSGEEGGVSYSVSATYDVALKPGWNVVLASTNYNFSEDSISVTSEVTTPKSLPSNVQFRVINSM